jgi:hypothetical protein
MAGTNYLVPVHLLGIHNAFFAKGTVPDVWRRDNLPIEVQRQGKI